jgi:ADP-ribose pyrophosphatase YjhB (NUDIX family)
MEHPNTEKCPDCNRHINRGTSVDAVIINGNKILLIKRGGDPFKGYWALPGGYVDWNESTEDAIAREVHEEVGLKVTDVHLIGVYSSPDRHPKQVINIAYSVSTEGNPRAGDDALACQWFPLSELPGEMAFDHLKIIDDHLAKK